MDESERIGKNNMIKEKGKETHIRHASMRPFCVELKLNLKCLNKANRKSSGTTSQSADGSAITSSRLMPIPSGHSTQ